MVNFSRNYTRQWDYRSLGNMGTNLNPFEGNQLQQLNQQISAGQGGTEIITLRRDIWETIPKQHFKEMGRLSKLAGVEPTIHGVIVEPVGAEIQGQSIAGWSDEKRMEESRMVNDILDKAIDLVDISKPRNISVTFHPDSLARAPVYRRADKELKGVTPDDKPIDIKLGQEIKVMDWAVDKETGQMMPVKLDEKLMPPETDEEKKLGYRKEIWTPDFSLRNLNKTSWMQEVEGLHARSFQLSEFEEKRAKGVHPEAMTGAINTMMSHVNSEIQTLFERTKKFNPLEEDNWKKLDSEKQKEKAELKKKYTEDRDKMLEENLKIERTVKEINEKIHKAKNEAEQALLFNLETDLMRQKIDKWAGFFGKTVNAYPIEKFTTFEEFAAPRVADTFARSAAHSWELAKERAAELKKEGKIVDPLKIAPAINLENPPANQFAFGRGDKIAEVVQKTRDRTAEILVKEKHVNPEEAKKIANRLVGATWDVGHINMLRPAGYSTEDLINEAKKAAKYVRHFHVTDNFGTTDSHLVPGQGNTHAFEQVAAIRDEAARQGFPVGPQVKEIMEIGGFVQHHKTSPWPYILENSNSPIYASGPQWHPPSEGEDIGSRYFFSEYSSGFGNILPAYHFGQYFGAGFSEVPVTLGGMTPGERSRFAGTPMA